MNAIRVTSGGSVSYAATLSLPDGVWSATCKAVDLGGLEYAFVVALTPSGPLAAGRRPYAITLDASSAQTAGWAEPGEELKTAEGRIRFADASVPPVVIWSERFSVQISGAPFA